MKTPFIFLLMLTLTLAQGLRLCVHAPAANEGSAAQALQAHYESDGEHCPEDQGSDYEVSYLKQNTYFLDVLAGSSALVVLLILLQLLAGQRPYFRYATGAVLPRTDCYRLRPPLRAPPR